jgi:Ca-activated chloride channel family protein
MTVPRTLAVLSLLAAAPPALADDVMLVLDESGSMWAQLGGKTKIEIARSVEPTAPEQPGDCEIRYVLNENEAIAAARPIRITAK